MLKKVKFKGVWRNRNFIIKESIDKKLAKRQGFKKYLVYVNGACMDMFDNLIEAKKYCKLSNNLLVEPELNKYKEIV